MNIDIYREKKWHEKKNYVLNAINQSGLPLVLFGAANFLEIAQYIKQIKVPIQFLCDNDVKKQSLKLYKCEIIAPEKIPVIYEKYNVLILVPFVEEITKQLQGLSIPPQQIFYLDLYFDYNLVGDYVEQNKERFEQVYKLLHDDKSRMVYEAVVNYWICRNQDLLLDISCPRQEQYFPEDLFALSNNEIFVDAGAFTGDSIRAFLNHVKNKYKAVYAFEPEINNYRILKEFIAAYENISSFEMGVSDESKDVTFIADTSSSKISENGTIKVHLEAIDNILKNIPITYLKMDVEGAELSALRGALHTIQTFKPKMAICTYHSIQDMVDIPLLIHKIDPRYKLYFRHYTNSIVETVCYALPDAK